MQCPDEEWRRLDLDSQALGIGCWVLNVWMMFSHEETWESIVLG